MHRSHIWPTVTAVILLLAAGCAPSPRAEAAPAPEPTLTPTAAAATATAAPTTAPALPTPTVHATSAATGAAPALDPARWQDFPVIPEVSAAARKIYAQGQALGNNPRAFSKVGDCESRTTWFLYDFDQGPRYYDLGSYTELQSVIDHFQGSFGRLSQVAKPGFTAASLLTSLWADPKACQKDETPLACEYRQVKPSFALIMLGTNDVSRPETFEQNMRKVIEFTIQQGIVPVLVTKADNLEGNHAINAAIARLAVEYDLPLWNFWKAVQDLPDHGLQEDGAHLTWSPNTFGDAEAMKRAWPVRNLTALQLLAALQAGVKQ